MNTPHPLQQPKPAAQELRLANVHLGVPPLLPRSASPSGPSEAPLPALSHLRRLAVHVSKDVDGALKAHLRMDALQQLAALAPHTGQLTALTLSGVAVLERHRAPELARILLMLPNLSDLEVRKCAAHAATVLVSNQACQVNVRAVPSLAVMLQLEAGG